MAEESIYDRIKQRLDEKGLSERQASIRAVGNSQFIRNIRKGQSVSPRGQNIAKLARVLEVSESWLLGSTDDMPPPPAESHGGFAEDELVPIGPATTAAADDLGPNTHHWRIGDSFAGLPGYRVGDVIEAEMGLEPRNRDDVLVQIEDRHGGASTVLRSFNKGFVWGAPGSDPEFVDGIRVRIVAVVRKSWRSRDGT